MVEKDLESKIAGIVGRLGFYGSEGDRITEKATDSALGSLYLGMDRVLVEADPTTFVRQAITDLGLDWKRRRLD
jgi:hypothetical protein